MARLADNFIVGSESGTFSNGFSTGENFFHELRVFRISLPCGLVTVTATAKGNLTSLSIDPSIFNPSEKEVVEDLILAAVKDAQMKASTKSQLEMERITQGLGLPAGMKLPF